MLVSILQRDNSSSHHLVDSLMHLLRRRPFTLVTSHVSLFPDVVDDHLKNHFDKNGIKSVQPVALDRIESKGPVWISPPTKEAPH